MAASQTPSPLLPQLADLRRQFDVNSTRAKVLFSGVDEPRLLQRPPSNGWSMGECVEHLTITTRNYLGLADKAFVNAARSNGPYKKDWMGALLAWYLDPPYRRRDKTLPAYEPGALEPARVLPDFLESQRGLIGRVEQANGLALDQIKVRSSFNEKITYNLYSFFCILAAHQRRHLWQAEQVKKSV
jgi:hypothetical protein